MDHLDKSEIKDNEILSASWIISCNNENPLMTFASIAHLLNLDNENGCGTERVKKIISRRVELFRLGAPTEWIEELRADMIKGQHQPSWISTIDDEEKRISVIKGLKSDDYFLNQFRTWKNAEKCENSQIEWGLKHIDALCEPDRNRVEKKNIFHSAAILPSLSLILAIISVLVSYFTQKNALQNQTELKTYELRFNSTLDIYKNIISNVSDAFIESSNQPADENKMASYFLDAQHNIYVTYPFLDSSRYDKVWNTYSNFEKLCYANIDTPVLSVDPRYSDRTKEFDKIRDTLADIMSLLFKFHYKR